MITPPTIAGAQDLDRAFSQLAEDLAGEAAVIPFRRAFEHHRDAIEAILDYGMTVRAMARRLADSGLRQRNGAEISEGHFRQLLRYVRSQETEVSVRLTPKSKLDGSIPARGVKGRAQATSAHRSPTVAAVATSLNRLADKQLVKSTQKSAEDESAARLNAHVDAMFGRKKK